VLSKPAVQAALRDFECTEWLYDGLKGQVIKWTKEHGNDNDDPAERVWVLDAAENVVGSPSSRELRSPEEFAAWLGQTKVEHDRRTGRIPPEMAVEWSDAIVRDPGEGEGPGLVLEGLAAAKQDAMPLFGYVAIPASKQDDRKLKPLRKRCEKLEHGALADETLAKLAARCFSVRFDFTKPKVRQYLKETWKIKKAPLLFVIDWTRKTPKPRLWTHAALKPKEVVRALKKILPKEEDP